MADIAPLSADQPVSVFKDLKDIWTKTGTLASCISIPVLGVNAVVNSAIDPYRQIAQIFLLTAPLCCSVTIVAMLWMRGSFKGMRDLEAAWIIFGALIFPYFIAFFLGAARSIDDKYTTVDNWAGYNPIMIAMKFAMGILVYYFSTYGLARSISSVICGCFLAWVFEYKLLPRIRRKIPMAA
jgi:hypothetical protein